DVLSLRHGKRPSRAAAECWSNPSARQQHSANTAVRLVKSPPNLMQRLSRLPAAPNVTLLDRRKPRPHPSSHANTTFTEQIYIRWCCIDLSNAPAFPYISNNVGPVKLFLNTLLSFHLKELFYFVFFGFLSSCIDGAPAVACHHWSPRSESSPRRCRSACPVEIVSEFR